MVNRALVVAVGVNGGSGVGSTSCATRSATCRDASTNPLERVNKEIKRRSRWSARC